MTIIIWTGNILCLHQRRLNAIKLGQAIRKQATGVLIPEPVAIKRLTT